MFLGGNDTHNQKCDSACNQNSEGEIDNSAEDIHCKPIIQKLKDTIFGGHSAPKDRSGAIGGGRNIKQGEDNLVDNYAENEP